MVFNYSKTGVRRPLSKRPKIGFQDQLSLNAGQKYCRMLKCNDVASDVGVNLCNVKSCLTRQTMRFSQIREAIFLALIYLSTRAQL